MEKKAGGEENILSGLSIVSYKRSGKSGWKLLYISDEIEVLSGYSALDFIENNTNLYKSLIFEEDKIKIMKIIEDKIMKKKAYEVSYRISNKSGDTIYLYEKGKGEYDENGQLLFLSGIIINITKQKRLEEELRASKEKYKYLANQFEAILDHIPGQIFYKDTKNCFVSVNKYTADVYGMSKSELEGKCLNEIYNEEEAQKYYEDDLDVMSSKNGKLNIIEPWQSNSGCGWVNTSKIPFISETGEIIGVIGISFDITEKIESEKKLEILQKTVEQAPYSIVITEPDGTICFANKAFYELTGYTQDEAIGENPRVLRLNNVAKVDFKNLWKTILDGSEWHGVFQNKKKNGDEYWERASIAPMYDHDGKLIKFIGIKEDVTKEHANEIELERLARIDMLTNLPNRRSFLESAESEFVRNKRYPQDSAFLMLDIDYFKRINDEFGHSVGDLALKEFSRVCAMTIRETDLIGRLGGEEFAIYLINTNYEDTCTVVERLRSNVESIELLSDEGAKIKFTVSIGITKPLITDIKLDAIFKRADSALYEAKKNGRNRAKWA